MEGKERRKTDNKDSNKENVSVFLLFFALSGSGLVWSGPLFSLSYTHTHALVCVFVFCRLLVRKQERKEEIVEPLNDFEIHMNLSSVSSQGTRGHYSVYTFFLKDKATDFQIFIIFYITLINLKFVFQILLLFYEYLISLSY